jgi:hypothetical protein
MNIFKNIPVAVLLIFIVADCSKSKKFEQSEKEKNTYQEQDLMEKEKDVDTQSDQRKEIRAEDIGKIHEFNPEVFVKLTILYRRESKKWFEEAQSLPPDAQSKYLEEANSNFFSTFGITEKEYTDYSQNNIEELNDYMEKHPELLPQFVQD